MKNKVYFLSDVHLGSAYHLIKAEEKGMVFPPSVKKVDHACHEIERKLCRWFDMVKSDAKTIYLLGDIFDYWFEYKNVVPRGFTRVMGKIAELTDMGVEMHFFIGNHDIWITDYLQRECGLIVHKDGLITEIAGKKFFLHHGDGLGDNSKFFKIIRPIFHSKFLRWLYAGIHPRWTVGFANSWSNHSRATGEMDTYLGEDKEHLVLFAKKQYAQTPDINFFILGHRHILLDLMISNSCRVAILGDWISFFSYGVFDGQNFSLEIFEEE